MLLELLNQTLPDSAQPLSPTQQWDWVWWFVLSGVVLVYIVCISITQPQVVQSISPDTADSNVDEKVVLFAHPYQKIDTQEGFEDVPIVIQFRQSKPISIPPRSLPTYQSYECADGV